MSDTHQPPSCDICSAALIRDTDQFGCAFKCTKCDQVWSNYGQGWSCTVLKVLWPARMDENSRMYREEFLPAKLVEWRPGSTRSGARRFWRREDFNMQTLPPKHPQLPGTGAKRWAPFSSLSQRSRMFIVTYYHAIPVAVTGAVVGWSPPYVRRFAALLGLKAKASLYAHNKRHPSYGSWCAMHERCRNQNCEKYSRYGGRGITVCARWADFAAFVQDMGSKPDGLSLDRIDNDGNYEPSNCRWADAKTQARGHLKYEAKLCIDCAERRPVRNDRCGRCSAYFAGMGKPRPHDLVRWECKRRAPRKTNGCFR